jgi:hypothetical protein
MPDNGKLDEILRLTKENNQMLRAIRRSAWIHSIFKILAYGVVIIILAWFYVHYVAPLLIQMLEMLNKLQGASSQAQGQLSQWTAQLEKLRAIIPGGASTSTP